MDRRTLILHRKPQAEAQKLTNSFGLYDIPAIVWKHLVDGQKEKKTS